MSPKEPTILDQGEELIEKLLARGAAGVVIGVRLASGATLTVQRGDLKGLSNQLRECVADSRAEMRAKAKRP